MTGVQTCALPIFILDATRARLIADVPVGAFLSGGVDSSVVVASMATCASGPVKTFSIGFPDQAFDETRFARMVATSFGTTHEEFVVQPQAVDLLPALAWHYDQPFADSSALPELRSAATLLAAMHVAITASVAEVEREVAPLTAGDGPWRHVALELVAVAAIKAGDVAKARQVYSQIADDGAAPQALRGRAAEMLAALGT